jgi:peptidoglycan/LPS O-acetylase OafA/YrhL
MKYRSDIQILRGIAVLLVVFYHFRIPGFENGFLGVDIFFVISGYLMAQIYKPDNKLSFYKGRVNRILPGFILVIISTVILGFVLTVPSDFFQIVRQSQFSLLLNPNIYFLAQESYFSNLHFNPLLHFWSLGIEFQFYILVPLIAFINRKRPNLLKAICLISAFGCFICLMTSPKAAFYLLPFRLWEFLIGYLVNGNSYGLKKFHKSTYLIIPFFLIAFTQFLQIDPLSNNFANGHPGFLSLMIVVATAVILVRGQVSTTKKFKYSFGLESIGNYSYEIYLVHFPLIVFLNYRPFQGTSMIIDEIYIYFAIFFALTGLVILLRFFVNHLRAMFFRIQTYAWIILFCLLGLLTVPNLQLIKFSSTERFISGAISDKGTFRCGELRRITFRLTNLVGQSGQICRITPVAKGENILLLGNSHADSVKNVFASVASQANLNLFFWAQNDILEGNQVDIEKIVGIINKAMITKVYIHNSAGTVEKATMIKLVDRLQIDNIQITILGPVPTWPKNVPENLWESRNNKSKMMSLTYEQFRSRNSSEFLFLSSGLGDSVKFYDLANFLCQPDCRLQSSEGRPYYYDSGHLTETGAKYLRPLFDKAVIAPID